MDIFGANLRRRAQELGISNAEVARRAGLSERRYGNYVSGRREPDLATLVRIASALAMTPNDLLVGYLEEVGTEEKRLQDRINAAAKALPATDLERIAIMIEALTSAKLP